MSKILTFAAMAAMLGGVMMTPATATPKLPTEHETVHFAPGHGVEVVEHGRHHKHFKFYSYGYGYSACYWGWSYGKKVWVCY